MANEYVLNAVVDVIEPIIIFKLEKKIKKYYGLGSR